ncbi:MAG: SH3 domain-containing protein [Acidobacteriota bacterium]|nr:SH3 domain-containing protein [Acidobacteriota bacterium]
MPAEARVEKHEKHWGAGMSVELELPFGEAVKLMTGVASDGIIRGTWEYKGSSELDGAQAATSASGFEPWNGHGVVLYKVRPGTVAPEHFYDSADRGTVAVRYILEADGPKTTRLRIDAVFDEDSHHHQHPSDGKVEDQEFVAISDRMTELADQKQKDLQQSSQQQQERKVQELQEQLAQEQAALEQANAREQQLLQQSKQVKGGRPATVRTESADVKLSPYTQSKTVQELAQGDFVTVLLQTQNWCRVQTASGERGWIYRLMLEVSQ